MCVCLYVCLRICVYIYIHNTCVFERCSEHSVRFDISHRDDVTEIARTAAYGCGVEDQATHGTQLWEHTAACAVHCNLSQNLEPSKAESGVGGFVPAPSLIGYSKTAWKPLLFSFLRMAGCCTEHVSRRERGSMRLASSSQNFDNFLR